MVLDQMVLDQMVLDQTVLDQTVLHRSIDTTGIWSIDTTSGQDAMDGGIFFHVCE